MWRPEQRRRTVAIGATALLLALSCFAWAHRTETVGHLRLVVGWSDEPAFSGSRNSVDVGVYDAAGKPVSDTGAVLTVEVSFGEERVVLPLLPEAARPGRFRAWLVPTRPGTYAFHVSGTVQGQVVDTRSSCSDQTFDCVIDSSEIQFPAKDPSPGQLAERIGRSLPRADRAAAEASLAQTLATTAIVLAALALAAAVGLGLRKRGKGN